MERNFTVLRLVRAVLLACVLCGAVEVRAQIAQVMGRRYIKVIQPMELKGRELNPYRVYSLADAVRYYSGIQFKDYGGIGGLSTINVRSLGSERIGVFYNGIELGNAMNGQVDLSRFSLDNVGNLSLYSGRKSDIFQSATDYASTGSLYITTRRPTFAEGSKTNVTAKVRGGYPLMVNPSLMVEHDLGHYVTLSASGELYYTRGNYPFRYRRANTKKELVYDFRSLRKNDEVYATRLEASLNGIFENGVWSVFAYHYGSDRGIPGPIVNNLRYRGEELSQRNHFVQGNLKFDVAEGYRTQVNYKFSADYTHYVNNDDKVQKVDEIYRSYDVYLSNSHLYMIMPGWDVSAAYDVHFNSLSKRDGVTSAVPADFELPMRLKNLLSLSTQSAIWFLQAQASVLGTYVKNFTQRKGFPVHADEKAISPALLLSYTPSRRVDFSIQAFAKHTYRVPSYNDRYLSRQESEWLLPESQWQYNFGLVFSNNGDGVVREYGASAEGFFHDIRNMIIAYPKGQLYRWSMVNLGHVYSYGAETSVYMRYRIASEFDLMLRAQYTYKRAEDVTHRYDTYYRNQIPNIPWHSGSAVVNMAWRGWSINYSFLYVGKRYSRQENIPYYRMAPWYTHDVSLAKAFKVGTGEMRIMLEVNNTLGQDFEIVTNYPMPSQLYRLTLMADI